MLDSRLAQGGGTLELDQGKTIGQWGQGMGDSQQPVPVGICLDDAPDARAPSLGTNPGMVVR